MRSSLEMNVDTVSALSNDAWLVDSQTHPGAPYVVRQCAEQCSDPARIGESCEAFRRCSGCRHMYSCTCADATAAAQTCKHILVVIRSLGIWQPQQSADSIFANISTPQCNDDVVARTCEQECQKLLSLVEVCSERSEF